MTLLSEVIGAGLLFEDGKVVATGGGQYIDVSGNMNLPGTLILNLSNLPTTDPQVAGQAWRDTTQGGGGYVVISSGPSVAGGGT